MALGALLLLIALLSLCIYIEEIKSPDLGHSETIWLQTKTGLVIYGVVATGMPSGCFGVRGAI